MGRQAVLESYEAGPAEPERTEAELRDDPFPAREDGTILHPLVRPRTVQARAFQQALARRSVRESLVCVLPTGLGKTIIAVLAAAELLRRGEGKIVFLAPTKPLVLQHRETFGRFLTLLPGEYAVFTGTTTAKKRAKAFGDARVVVATPQVIDNDVRAGRYDLRDVAFMIYDEAHRAVGDYAYVPLAKAYREQRVSPRSLGLTASPGKDRERIEEVLANLGIRAVEARDHAAADVAAYVKDIRVEWVPVSMTAAMLRLRKLLADLLREKVEKLRRSGFLTYRQPDQVSRKDILAAGDRIRARMGKRKGMGYLFGAIHNQSVAMHAHHCLELLETQGVEPLSDYLRRMGAEEKPSRSERSFLKDPKTAKVVEALGKWKGQSHPKVGELVRILRDQFHEKPESLVIVFTQYRDTIRSILRVLDGVPGLTTARFVGQATRTEEDPGLSQREQKETLERFARGDVRVLVASSVAEEGLDVPSVDVVVFYEPVPSEIRAIQRRGRTGRNEVGRVVLLVTKDSRDEAYLYAEMAREKKMKRVVTSLERLARDERDAGDARDGEGGTADGA